MPPLVYSAQSHETAARYRGVATAVDLPVMVYNNPATYRTDVSPQILASLADCENIVCVKDSSGDTGFTDLRNTVGDRFTLFAGLDNVVFESLLGGAMGWVSGMSNVFPKEGEALFRLVQAAWKRRAPFTTGSCRCCILMRARIWFRRSSCASTLPVAERT